MKEELQKSGLTKEVAQKVLADWKEQVGHEVTPDDLRKVRRLVVPHPVAPALESAVGEAAGVQAVLQSCHCNSPWP